MDTYLRDFESWLRNEDKGDKTVRTYLSVMSKFVEWYEGTEGKCFELRDVSPVQLHDYRSHMQTVENCKPATINKALATFKTFFAWAVDSGHIGSNPALKVKMKRVQQAHAPKWLNEQEQNRLLYALETEKNECKQARDKAIVMSMLYAGLRVEETSELKTQHIDLRNDEVIVVDGKGGKYRTVSMTKELKKVLKVWASFRNESRKSQHQMSEYFFVSERSGQMTTRGIAYLVDGYLERCGLLERSQEGRKSEGQASCHTLRHTFCKNLINRGWPIQNVARVAGHDSIQTTMRYVEPSKDELRLAMQRM